MYGVHHSARGFLTFHFERWLWRLPAFARHHHSGSALVDHEGHEVHHELDDAVSTTTTSAPHQRGRPRHVRHFAKKNRRRLASWGW